VIVTVASISLVSWQFLPGRGGGNGMMPQQASRDALLAAHAMNEAAYVESFG
jgi:hypothetical protein